MEFDGDNIEMNAKEYQKIYQNIKEKAPIESGVQTLVYMFLYEIMKDTDYQLIVIDHMDKKTQFVTSAGISDLAIVLDNFRFSEEHKDKIISYVEVKGINTKLYDFEDQIKGQLLSCGKILVTNGGVWRYYDIEKYLTRHSKNNAEYAKEENDYKNVKTINDHLESLERKLAKTKSSYAHTREEIHKNALEEEIKKLEKEKIKTDIALKESLKNNPLLQEAIQTPIIDMTLYNNDGFDVNQYEKLKSELCDVILLW